MAKKTLRRYATHHKFDYPKFGKVVRARSDRKVFRKASRGEDTAHLVYKAMQKSPRSQAYKNIMYRIRHGRV